MLSFLDLPNGKGKISEMIQNSTPFDWEPILQLSLAKSNMTLGTGRARDEKKRRKSITWEDDIEDIDSALPDSKDANFQHFLGLSRTTPPSTRSRPRSSTTATEVGDRHVETST